MVTGEEDVNRDKNLLDKFSSAAKTIPAPDKCASAERICFIHEGKEGLYYCPNCNVWRCKECAHVYNGVGVCPDCDSFSVHFSKREEQITKREEPPKTFSWEIKRAFSFPFRRYISTLLIWLAVWMTAVVGDGTADMMSSRSIKEIILGPMVGLVGKLFAFGLLASISTAFMIARSDGREGWESSKIEDYSIFTEPIAFWAGAALFGLCPLIAYLTIEEVRGVVVSVITGIDYSKYRPGNTIFSYLSILILSLWAIFIYPMGLIVAVMRRSVTPLFNPLNAVSAWIAMRKWLKPAFAIVAALNLITMALVFTSEWRYGLAIATAVATITFLISSQIIGASINRGWQKLDLN
jgi:hypothetical protein